ncbi:MAG: hypothetical protein Fur0023_04860 [Bacteroidia bacterium]
MQLHPNNSGKYGREKIEKILKKGVIGMGDKNGSQLDEFKDEMQVGDIVLIRSRGPFALVKVTGEYKDNDIEEEDDDVEDPLFWFDIIREVEVLSMEGDKFRAEYKRNWMEKDDGYQINSRLILQMVNDWPFIKFWYEQLNENIKRMIDILEYKKQIILQGPPGTGKTRCAIQIAEELVRDNQGEYKIIQFHPSYSYEDFVRGIVAEVGKDGNLSYRVENKILAEFAQKAIDNKDKKYVLIIDEINRANLPSVFGELIYALEYRGKNITSMYKYQENRDIMLPENLFIIGTMNTADRSVGHIDYAIRRRFTFVNLKPDESVIKDDQARKLFNEIKDKIFSEQYLSPEFHVDDVMIGHSYFLLNENSKDKEKELRMKLDYEIKPLLMEYVKDGIFLNSKKILEEITNLKVSENTND